MLANAIAAGFRVEPQPHGPGREIDAAAKLEKRFEPYPESANLIASLGGTARVQQSNYPAFVKRRASICSFQPLSGKAHTDPTMGLPGLKNCVGSILDEFVELTIGVSTGEYLVFGFEVLCCIPWLGFVCFQSFLALIVNELGVLPKLRLVGANIHVHHKLVIENNSAGVMEARVVAKDGMRQLLTRVASPLGG